MYQSATANLSLGAFYILQYNSSSRSWSRRMHTIKIQHPERIPWPASDSTFLRILVIVALCRGRYFTKDYLISIDGSSSYHPVCWNTSSFPDCWSWHCYSNNNLACKIKKRFKEQDASRGSLYENMSSRREWLLPLDNVTANMLISQLNRNNWRWRS